MRRRYAGTLQPLPFTPVIGMTFKTNHADDNRNKIPSLKITTSVHTVETFSTILTTTIVSKCNRMQHYIELYGKGLQYCFKYAKAATQL